MAEVEVLAEHDEPDQEGVHEDLLHEVLGLLAGTKEHLPAVLRQKM